MYLGEFYFILFILEKTEVILTLGVQRERRKFEKQPSHTMVKGAYAVIVSPSLVL